MQTVRIDEAQARLPQLVDSASAGEEIVITRDDQPVAKLTPPEHGGTLRDIRPTSVGAVLRPFDADDDLLDEMTAGR